MITLKSAIQSSVGKKLLMGLSGIALVLFVITHLLGNLSLYLSDGAAFNHYAESLASLGKLLILAEFGLIGAFALHILMGFIVTVQSKSARPIGYSMVQSKGDPSKSTLASRNMIITGVVLLAFLIMHIWQFKFGPGVAEGYVTQVEGKEVRDLQRLVVETFRQPLFVGIYCFVMLLLGAHLRHGFWSAFQSLGVNNPRISKPIYGLALLMAILLSAGFFFIPIWIYFRG